ncbi:hypothetical protein SETIT_5G142000v2 [Setaria italica]|uniref:Uncharacterized protein n=1 Tax=Setaria italica TaxID=4555 RepID=A0A368R4R5_SETIT|nr:hypothetical protein SETIT_5G142000v2 [Setaria italica]
MECEPEKLQFSGVAGIYTTSVSILRGPHWPLFAPCRHRLRPPALLSTLFLLHVTISHALFTHIDTDDTALDSSTPGTDAQRRLLSRLASDWLALLLFKDAYLLALLLLATAAAVFPVASVYSTKHDALTIPRLLAFLLIVAYLVGLIYINVVWHLANVVSMFEDYKVLAAMRKSRDLIMKKLRDFFCKSSTNYGSSTPKNLD